MPLSPLTPLLPLTTPAAWAADAPALLLANVYRPGMPLADYWVSEKYDGVRGYWDGHTLRTRGGETGGGPRVVYRRLAHHAHGRRSCGPALAALPMPSPPPGNSNLTMPRGDRCASWCLTCPPTAVCLTNAWAP